MKDTVITAKRKKTEFIAFIVCFILANLLNIYAIIRYNTTAWEVLTSLGFVLIASFVLYGLWVLARLVFFGIRKAFSK
ncbi:hypothetical protein [Bacteroides sp. 51]|uniref:hypothetical protein n=1 Tax=Bacteroides sp. 51 TaxID=2302938 RepID=UPI0013D7FAE5|nr:hypothetical protein [Bacteroides sp. 51]NDV80982.1 hypothetical protein [Bacteroides sp. 51]